MTSPRLSVCLMLMLFSCSLLGQNGKHPSPGDIELAEKLKTAYPKAEIVSKSTHDQFHFDFDQKSKKVVVQHKNHQHLMALQNGVEYQPYEFYDDVTSVESAGAAFQNKKRTAIGLKREKYSSNDFFHTDTKVAFFDLHFETKGFQYKIHFDKKYRDVKYLTSVYFHEDIPLLDKQISFSIPSWLEVELKEINFEGYAITKQVTEEKNYKTYNYSIKGLESRINESNAPGASHIFPHILVLAKSYQHNGEQHQLFETTQDLYNWYLSLINTMDDDVSTLEPLVKELIAHKASDVEKIKSIYYWIQNNIRYIAFEDGLAGFKPDESQNVLKKKYGDCKGMANLCKQMLLIAGYDARLSWIGTRHIAYDYSLPSLAADNHMICTVQLEGQRYFLDPTESFGAFNEYAERIQGRPAMIENGNEYIIAPIPIASPKDNSEAQEFHLSIEGETLTGSVEHTFLGESKSALLYQLNNTETNQRTDQLKAYINEQNKDYVVANMTYSDIADRDNAFECGYDLKLNNHVSRFGDELYISPDFYQEWKDISFNDRAYDFLLPYKTRSSTKYVIDIPGGYRVTQLPLPVIYESDYLNIKASYRIENSRIVYTKLIEIPQARIPSKDFGDFDNIIEILSEFYNEQITLTKE